MTAEELVKAILEKAGTIDNVTSAINCMTRLRITVKDDSAVDEEGIKRVDGVLGVIHDREKYMEVVVGPGLSSKCGDICRQMGIPSAVNEWKENRAAMLAERKESRLRDTLKIFGEIFVPLIPGVIASGLCAGLNILLQQIFPGWEDNAVLRVLCPMLSLIHTSFLTYITAWTGYRTAERFGGTPVLGGMLGLITILEGINTVSQNTGMWNSELPLESILRSGRGGILAVVFGVLIMVRVEKWIRSRMPSSLDVVFTPLLTLLVCLIPYVFIIMPGFGLISEAVCSAIQTVCMSENIFVRILAGYVSAALFLPMVSMGMHHGFVALYSIQLEQAGYITLYPSLCMAGAGQVGAAAAIYLKAKKPGNSRLRQIIAGALPAGILGIGEPLVYGVTLPMGKPFITAGLGAGFGGAFVMAMQVASSAWGTSGVLAVFSMTAGPAGALRGAVCYLAGLVIACAAGFAITLVILRDDEIERA